MTGAGWWCVEAASGLLEPQEREAVLGDLAEKGESAWRNLTEVLGLAARRQILAWTTWRPWVSTLGLALPNSFQLMGFSVLVSSMLGQMLQWNLGASSVSLLLCRMLLLAIVSWSCGFAVGRVSRKTLWASFTACFLPCLFCLSRFAMPHRSPASLFLFAPFAIWGVWVGLYRNRVPINLAISLAGTATVLAIPGLTIFGAVISNGTIAGGARHWIYFVVLIWPVWYQAVNALKQSVNAQSG